MNEKYRVFFIASFDKKIWLIQKKAVLLQTVKGALAHLVERYIRIVEVGGSSPLCSTIIVYLLFSHINILLT